MINLKNKIFLLLFIFSLTSNIFSEDIIVESRDGGQNFNCYSEKSGNWADSVAKSLADGVTPGIGSRFISADGPVQASFEVVPNIPADGKYEIFVTFGTSGNTDNCRYTIVVNDTEIKKVYINQRGWGVQELQDPGNGNVWISLGIYDLPQGNKTKLIGSGEEITGKADVKNNARFYADAFKFSTSSGTPSSSAVSSASQTSPFAAPQTSQSNNPFLLPTATPPQVTQSYTTSPFAPIQNPQSTPTSPFASSQTTSGQTNWIYDYAQAIKEGTRLNKPIILFFYSEMGKLSQQMENQVLGNSSVLPYLQQYICCKILITDQANAKLSEYYEVFKAPTLIFLNSQGYMKGREDKSIDAQGMINLLESMK